MHIRHNTTACYHLVLTCQEERVPGRWVAKPAQRRGQGGGSGGGGGYCRGRAAMDTGHQSAGAAAADGIACGGSNGALLLSLLAQADTARPSLAAEQHAVDSPIGAP